MNDQFGHATGQHLRKLVDQVPAMLAYWDRELRCRFANRAYERWFGVNPESLVGTSLRDLLGAPLFALNEPYIRAALQGKEQLFERILPGPDGAKRHSLANYVPDIVDGEVVGFIAHVTEVTQLKETEAALRAEAAQRETAMQRLHESRASLVEAQRLGGVGNWEWEIASDITIWSDELYRIFGRDPKRLPPTFAEHPSLYSGESWKRLQEAVAMAMRTGEAYTLELEYLRTDGKSGWLEARGEAVRSATGEIIRLRGTVHEVTLRHRMEATRVEALAAERASRNKTLMLSRISHELRTPLNAILGFSHLFERDASLDPKHRRRATMVIDAARHMLELIEEVLDLSAAEAGRIDIRLADIEATSIVRECLLQASAAALAGGITLRGVYPQSGHVQVRSDAKRLKQVIDNLVSNAVKYTHAGGLVQVTVAELANRVEIAVQDTGTGLTQAQIERLFVPFERLGAETSAIPGTGLGLALSKTLAELMHASIRVESDAGQGSTFTVSLPKVLVNDAFASERHPPAINAGKTIDPLSRR